MTLQVVPRVRLEKGVKRGNDGPPDTSKLCVMNDLKTIIPSRKATQQYLGEESDDHED